MNKWYNEGLVYRDFPLMRVSDDYINLLKTGRVGAFSGNWDLVYRADYNINAELAKNVPGAEFVPIDPFQNAQGVTVKTISDRAGLRAFVPASSRNPEAALKYLNWLTKYENLNFLQLGQEGVNHIMVNGAPVVFGMPANHPWIQNSSNNIDMTIPINGVLIKNAQGVLTPFVAGNYGDTPAATITTAVTYASVNGRTTPVVAGATPTKLGPVDQTLKDKADALLAQAITASIANFDSVWDAGYRDWLSSGAQEVMDERASLWR